MIVNHARIEGQRNNKFLDTASITARLTVSPQVVLSERTLPSSFCIASRSLQKRKKMIFCACTALEFNINFSGGILIFTHSLAPLVGINE